MINEQEKKQRIKEITSKMVKVQIFGAPGTILVGLALYGIFGANGNAFHPLLNNMDVVYGMFIVGGAIMVWEFIAYISLLKERNELTKSS